MGVELNIVRELSTVCVTASELAAIENLIKAELNKPAFVAQFDLMADAIAECYAETVAILLPWLEMTKESEFCEKFDFAHADYKATYLTFTNRPRVSSDHAYNAYMLLREFKEMQTAYPLLKRTFARLDEFIDKWITNDAWLAMSIENLLKMLNRFLNEVAELKQKDPTDAFIIFQAAMGAVRPFYVLLDTEKTKQVCIA
jgi:type I site-specific restriction endonuclease